MAAPTEIYVDPSIAADSGTGTIGDPYGDLQYALNQVTQDSTNGDRFNIKTGTDELLSASLSLATYGTPSLSAPLIFEGYASAAGDGDFEAGTGIGGIDMQGNNASILAATSGVHFKNMHLHNTGTAAVLPITTDQMVIACEINNSSGNGIDSGTTNRTTIVRCHIHDIGGVGAKTARFILYCYFANGTKDFSSAIQLGGSSGVIGNIITLDGASNGIAHASVGIDVLVAHNSVLASSGSGKGISMSSAVQLDAMFYNNLVEGFSNSGTGIELASGTRQNAVYAANAVYNNTTNYSQAGNTDWLTVDDNETLTGSPFAKSGADTFANRFTYFEAADQGNVRGGAYPSGSRLDKGAVQHADPAGGGGSRLIGVGGGIIG